MDEDDFLNIGNKYNLDEEDDSSTIVEEQKSKIERIISDDLIKGEATVQDVDATIEHTKDLITIESFLHQTNGINRRMATEINSKLSKPPYKTTNAYTTHVSKVGYKNTLESISEEIHNQQLLVINTIIENLKAEIYKGKEERERATLIKAYIEQERKIYIQVMSDEDVKGKNIRMQYKVVMNEQFIKDINYQISEAIIDDIIPETAIASSISYFIAKEPYTSIEKLLLAIVDRTGFVIQQLEDLLSNKEYDKVYYTKMTEYAKSVSHNLINANKLLVGILGQYKTLLDTLQ